MFIILLAAVYYVVRFSPAVQQMMARMFVALRQLVGPYLGGTAPPGVGNAGSAPPDSAMLVSKLQALRARFYGSESCQWTVKQLELFPEAVRRSVRDSIYVDCSVKPEACAAVTHYPTWEINGAMMPPGMVALQQLNTQCDAIFVESRKKNKPGKQPGSPAAADLAGVSTDDLSEIGDVLRTPPPASAEIKAVAEEEAIIGVADDIPEDVTDIPADDGAEEEIGDPAADEGGDEGDEIIDLAPAGAKKDSPVAAVVASIEATVEAVKKPPKRRGKQRG